MGLTVFGYRFENAALLEEALTTPSFRMTSPGAKDNQRLEFLGDAVLGLLAADRLYADGPDLPEGDLTVRRVHMVSAAALCEAASRSDFVSLLRRNVGAGPLARNAKTIADAVEAVIGAAYLDGGLEAARVIFETLALDPESAASDNPKGDLQVRVQSMEPPRLPTYVLLSQTGPSHAPTFTVRVDVEGVGSETASAGNRKEAEAKAASILLRKLNNDIMGR